MADDKSLSVVLRAVDQVTGPLARIKIGLGSFASGVNRVTTPYQQTLARFRSDLPGIQAGLGKFQESIGGTIKAASALGFKVAAGFGVAAFGAYHLERSAVDAGDKLNEMAKRTGLGATAFASLQFAAAQSDVEVEQFNGSIDLFSKGLGQASAGTGRFYAFLKKVNPAFAEQVKHAKGTEDGLRLMTEAFSKIEDPSKRAALSMAAFGDPQFGVFLSQGTAEITKMREEFVRLSGGQEEFAHRSDVLDNTLRTTATAFGGLRNAVAAQFMPVFNRLADRLTTFILEHKEGIIQWAKDAAGAFQAWANNGGLERLADGVENFATTLRDCVRDAGGLKNIAIGAGFILAGPFLSSIVTLTGALATGLIPALWSTVRAIGGLALGPVISLFSDLFIGIRAGIPVVESFNLALAANPLAVVTVAVVALGAAIYELVKHWNVLKESGFFSFGDKVAWAKDLFGFHETDAEAFKRTTGGTGRSAFQPPAPLPAPGATAGRAGESQARVTVDFVSLPRGSRVTADPRNTAPVDLSVGYTGLVTP